jgi:hypothetical protein
MLGIFATSEEEDPDRSVPGISATSEEDRGGPGIHEDPGSATSRQRRREKDPGSIPGICNRFQEERKSVVKKEMCLIDMI